MKVCNPTPPSLLAIHRELEPFPACVSGAVAYQVQSGAAVRLPGFKDDDLGVSGGRWAASVAT